MFHVLKQAMSLTKEHVALRVLQLLMALLLLNVGTPIQMVVQLF